MASYYNELDPYCAEWLRNLIAAGHIAPGDVDERSIKDVRPDDLKGYAQCHFFAGIGGWSRALRLAGWPDDRPTWTGSCPCQPFSAAGRQKGTADERHLWPDWFRLIRECRPSAVFGEQVASAIGHGWLDLVFDDLEAQDYACGAIVLPACGVGAPHIRQRLWFVGSLEHAAREQVGVPRRARIARGSVGELDDASSARLVATRQGPEDQARNETRLRGPERGCSIGELADSTRDGRREERADVGRQPARDRTEGRAAGLESGGMSNVWLPCDWLPCIDGKARPAKPGIFPLAHGIPARVGKLRAAGNAIVPQVGEAFIKACYGGLLT